MQKIKGLLVLVMMLPLMATAASNVAVLDPVAALANTDFIKQRQKDIQKELKGDMDKAQRLYGELQELQDNLQKNGMTMSEKDKTKLQDQFTTKNMELQSLDQTLTERVKQDQAETMQKVQPKMQQVVNNIVAKKKLDLILDIRSAHFFQPEVDITDEVTAALNKMNLK